MATKKTTTRATKTVKEVHPIRYTFKDRSPGGDDYRLNVFVGSHKEAWGDNAWDKASPEVDQSTVLCLGISDWDETELEVTLTKEQAEKLVEAISEALPKLTFTNAMTEPSGEIIRL